MFCNILHFSDLRGKPHCQDKPKGPLESQIYKVSKKEFGSAFEIASQIIASQQLTTTASGQSLGLHPIIMSFPSIKTGVIVVNVQEDTAEEMHSWAERNKFIPPDYLSQGQSSSQASDTVPKDTTTVTSSPSAPPTTQQSGDNTDRNVTNPAPTSHPQSATPVSSTETIAGSLNSPGKQSRSQARHEARKKRDQKSEDFSIAAATNELKEIMEKTDQSSKNVSQVDETTSSKVGQFSSSRVKVKKSKDDTQDTQQTPGDSTTSHDQGTGTTATSSTQSTSSLTM